MPDVTVSAAIDTFMQATASTMNINGTVGATTPAAGSFTTLSASSTITGNGRIQANYANPLIQWYNTSGASDEKRVDFQASGATFIGRLINDADSVAINWLRVTRSGTTSVTSVDLYGGTSVVASVTSTGLAVTGVKTNIYAGAGPGNYIQNSSDTSGTTFLAFNKAAGTAIGSVTRVTTTDVVAYNTTSDGRLKTNIRDFTAADSGRIIDGLQPRWFDWKPSDLTETVEETVDSGKVDDKGEHVMEKRAKQQKVTDPARIAKHVADNQSHVGFVAQEEAAIDPLLARIGAVTVGDDDPDNITKQWQRSDSALVPILVAEIKSLRARVAVLEV